MSNTNKTSVNEDSFEIFLEKEILAITNSKRSFKKINKWLKCGITCISDAAFVEILSFMIMLCFTIKIIVFITLKTHFACIPIIFTGLTFISIIFLLFGIHKVNILYMIPFKYMFTLYTVFESIHFILEIIYIAIQLMNSVNDDDTIKHEHGKKPTNFFILLNESVPTKNKMDYVFYLILCIIMLVILLYYYIVSKKYIEEMEIIFEIEDIIRGYEDPKANHNNTNNNNIHQK